VNKFSLWVGIALIGASGTLKKFMIPQQFNNFMTTQVGIGLCPRRCPEEMTNGRSQEESLKDFWPVGRGQLHAWGAEEEDMELSLLNTSKENCFAAKTSHLG
jgi:hypothetical protein